MPLTTTFQGNIRARAPARSEIPSSALREPSSASSIGDLATGKAVLRDYVNATAGFQDLEKRTQIPAKSLMRMLGPKGSPSRRESLQHPHRVYKETEGVQLPRFR